MAQQLITFGSNKEHDVAQHDGWLDGHLLVATPLVRGDVFEHSVIYMLSHSEHGAMGIVINKPLELVHYAELFSQINVPLNGAIEDLRIYHGGPVEEHRGFVLHSPDVAVEDTLVHENGIAVTANASILRAIAAGNGPRQRQMMVGYAGWGAGQLEAEIEANSWITVPATPELVFHTPDEAKWAVAAKSLGVDMVRYSYAAGHA